MQHRRRRIERRHRIDHCRQRFVIHVDELERVLGEIAVAGDHHRDRLADIAHAIDRNRPAFDRRLDADREARRQRLDLGAGDHGDNAGRPPRGGQVDRADVGMRMRGAKNSGVTRARRYADIVDEAAAAGEQRQVFDALDRLADPVRGR